MSFRTSQVNELMVKYERLIHYVLNNSSIYQDRDEYDDFAQELRMKLIVLAESSVYDPFTQDGPFTAYAKRELRYKLVALLRKQNRQTALDPIAWDDKVEDAHVIPCHDEARIIDKLAIMDIKKKLDARNREILRLQYEEGYTVKEIAEHLNISRAAISRRRRKIAEIIMRHLFMDKDKDADKM